MRVVPLDLTSGSDGSWELRADYPSERVVEQYRLDSSGRVVHMQARTWMGARELTEMSA